MSSFKNYGIAGVGSSIQFGKGGGVLKYDPVNLRYQFLSSDETELAKLQVGFPLNSDDAVTYSLLSTYYSNYSASKRAVSLVVTDNMPVNTVQTGTFSYDSLTVAVAATGTRVLLTGQTNPVENGIYNVNVIVDKNNQQQNSYTLTRANDFSDMDLWGKSNPYGIPNGVTVYVTNGKYKNTIWAMKTGSGTMTVGKVANTWVQVSSSLNADNVTIAQTDNTLSVKGDSVSGHVLTSDGQGSAKWESLSFLSDSKGNKIFSVVDSDKQNVVSLAASQTEISVGPVKSDVIEIAPTKADQSIRLHIIGSGFIGFGDEYNSHICKLPSMFPAESAATKGYVDQSTNDTVHAAVMKLANGNVTQTVDLLPNETLFVDSVKVTVTNPITKVEDGNNNELSKWKLTFQIDDYVLCTSSEDFNTTKAGTYKVDLPVDEVSGFFKAVLQDADGNQIGIDSIKDGAINVMVKYVVTTSTV